MPPRSKSRKIYNRNIALPEQNSHFLQLGGYKFFLFQQEVPSEGFGPSVNFYITDGRTNFTVDITQFNLQETEKIVEFFNEIIRIMRLINARRDEVARRVFEEKGTVYPRLYRPVPNLVVTPRARDYDSEELFKRPADIQEES